MATGEGLLNWARSLVEQREKLDSLLKENKESGTYKNKGVEGRLVENASNQQRFYKVVGFMPEKALAESPETLKASADQRATARERSRGIHRSAMAATTGRPPSRGRRGHIPGPFRG
jgi:hypothetical protein